MNDEFYIGWNAQAPPGIRKAIRRVLIAIVLGSLVASLILACSQHLIGTSVFEWGIQKNLAGVFLAKPYPHLLVPRPGISTTQDKFSTYYLVAQGKFGLPAADVTALDGKCVKLKGTLIYRENQVMVETSPAWIQPDDSTIAPPLPPTIPIGRQTLIGEIVDSKCFLGVMNPGQLAPHRACAIRCISGGIPPVLLVRPKIGPLVYLLLVSAEGKPVNRQVLDFVAEPVEITGDVEQQGELLILRADPGTYRRVNSGPSH